MQILRGDRLQRTFRSLFWYLFQLQVKDKTHETNLKRKTVIEYYIALGWRNGKLGDMHEVYVSRKPAHALAWNNPFIQKG
jgi:hypothetical protein